MQKFKLFLIAVIVISASVRLYQLGSHISAAYGDEVAIAYNAYSILKTGRDEFSEFMPLQFRSWGDQKNPVYIYTVSLFQIFFGINNWSVRLPSAISGILAVYLTYHITLILINTTNPQSNQSVAKSIALIAALLLALNPWHLHISRGGYEANMALTLGLGGILFLLRWLKLQQKVDQPWLAKNTILPLMLFGFASYTYYTTKMFIPLIAFWILLWGSCIVWVSRPNLNIKKTILSATIFLLGLFVISIPYIYLALFSSGQARFASINIFANTGVAQRVNEERGFWQGPAWLGELVINKPIMWARDFTHYFLDNLGVLYWYVFGDSTLRYTIGNHGVFYTFEAPFFILGLMFMFSYNKRLWLFLVSWLIIAVLPTSFVGKSYSLRSLAMLPVPMIFVAYGVVHSLLYLNSISKKLANKFSKMLAISFCATPSFLFVLSAINFLLRYSYAYPTYGYYWYDGIFKDIYQYTKEREEQVDNILITNHFGKAQLYYAYYNTTDPSYYQQQSRANQDSNTQELVKLDKYYFGDINEENISLLQGKTLIIAPPYTLSGEEILAKDDRRVLFVSKIKD